MLEEMIQSPVHLSLEECLSGSLVDQMLNFDNEDELLEEAGNTSVVLSPTPTNNVACSSDVAAAAVTFPATVLPCYDENSFDSDILSVLLNPQPPPEPEPDILTSFPAASMAPIHQMDQYNPMISNPPFTSYAPSSVAASQLPLDPSVLPGYMAMEPSAMQHCTFMDANGGIGGELYTDRMGMPACVADDEMGIYAGIGMPVRPPEAAEAAGGLGGIYTYGAMQRVYSPGNIQVLGDNQQHIRPMCSTSTAPLQVPSDISTMDDSNCKVSRVSAVEKRVKIDRYKMKRKRRNFSKTIKYACRKTLADSRPRVRGRFAKNNDEFSEVAPTPSSANGGYYDEEMALRNDDDEDRLDESSDILAHISGVNSFGFNYPVESWI